MFSFQFLNDKIHNSVFSFKIEKKTHFPQRIYKLSRSNIFFSRFEGMRGEKKNISHQGDNNEIDAGQCDQKPVEYVSHGTHAQYNNGQ